jgi:hypothetical protein
MNHGRSSELNGDAPAVPAATATPIDRVVLPADQAAATVVVVDPVSPIDKIEPGSVPRIAPSPDAAEEVGPVVITPVDVAAPAATAPVAVGPVAVGPVAAGAVSSATRPTKARAAAHVEPRWRRPLLLGIAALAVVAILALLATLVRSNDNKSEQAAVTEATTPATVRTTATTAAAVTSVATTVPATVTALPRTTSPATTIEPTTVAATEPPTTTEAPAAVTIPAPKIYDGRGNKTIKVALPGDGPVLMYLTHTGKRSFIVNGLDAKGKQLFNAVNNIGAFTGSVIVDDVSSLQITADGVWHVELRSILSARQFANTVAGTGPEVLIYTGVAGTATMLHEGTKVFHVELRTSAGNSELAKANGAFEGTAPMPAGFAIVAIMADGAWNVTVG